MNLKLQKSLRKYGAIFEERQNLIPATIGTDDEFGQVDVPGKDNYVYVRIQSGEIAQAYNTKVVALAGLRVWCGYEKTRPGLLQVLDVRNVYGKEYQQKVPAHAPTHEYGGYDQVFIRGEQFVPKLVSKYSGMTVRVQAGAIYTDDFGWYWHRPQEISLTPYVPTTGAHWALIEVGYSGTINVKLGSTVESKYLLFENTIPAPSNNAQPVAAVAMYQNQSGINMSKYGNNDILDLRWYQAIATGTAGGGGGIPEAPIDGNLYGRKNAGWTIVSGSSGMSEAPLDGLQYGRQSGSWTQISGSAAGATAYSALTDVRISGTMSNGNTPVWIAASGAWYPMPTWEDSKDPTGFVNNDAIHMAHNQANNTVYLSGTLDYYWHGIKRTLGDGVTWTSPSHSGTAGLYYLYSSDGINFNWSTSAWTFDLLQVAYSVLVTGTYGYHFGVRECHGLMQWQVHEELHRTISAYRESGGAPVVGSYQLNSDNNAHTRPTFAQAQIHDEDIDTTIPMVTGSYTTLRILTGTYSTVFQTGEDYPFRATGSYILINNPTLGSETAAVTNRYVNVYQIMIPAMADAESQKFRMVFLQPQVEYTSQLLAVEEDISHLDLGNFSSQFAEAVYYTRLTYYTNASYVNIGKVRLVNLSYVSRFGAGTAAGGGDAVPATYVLSGTNYNMPASVGTAMEYARADHLHGTPPSGVMEAPIDNTPYMRASGTWRKTYYSDGFGLGNIVIGKDSSLFRSGTFAGQSNVILGERAGYRLLTGTGNVLIGYDVGFKLTHGNYNSGFGYKALESLISGSFNVAFANSAMASAEYGIGNTVIGQSSMRNFTSGSKNLAIGYFAGEHWATGSYNNYFILDSYGRVSLADQNANAFMYGEMGATSANQSLVVNASIYTPRRVWISGTVDETQLHVVGYSSQSGSILRVQRYNGQNLFEVRDNGQVLITGSAIVLGGGTTTINNDIRLNQSSGTSVYPNLIGNQNSSNLYYTVSDRMYTSGRLLVFLNGQALSNGVDWAEQFPVSGTFYFISGSYIPTSTDIITAQYTISGSLSVADAPMTGLQYGRQSGTWTAITGSGGGGITDAPLDGLPYIRQSGTWKSRYAVELESSPTTHGITGTTATGSTYTSVACEFTLGLPILLSSIIWSNYRTGTYNINIYTAGGGKSLFSTFQYFNANSDNLVSLPKELLLLPGNYRIYVSGTGAVNWYRWSAAAPVVEGIMYYNAGLFNNAVVTNYFPVAKIVGRIQVP